GIASSLYTLGRVAFCSGDAGRASRLFDESLDLSIEVGYPEGIGYCLAGIGQVALAAGEPAEAARLFGAADAMFERIGAAMQQLERDALDAAIADARLQLGDGAFDTAWAAGCALGRNGSDDDVVAVVPGRVVERAAARHDHEPRASGA